MDDSKETQYRGAARTKTRIYATVTYVQQSARARVIDLSETGIALELEEPISAAANSQVRIVSPELGHLTGIVVWNHGGRLGLRLSLSTNTLAQLSSYFRFFHQDITPTISR